MVVVANVCCSRRQCCLRICMLSISMISQRGQSPVLIQVAARDAHEDIVDWHEQQWEKLRLLNTGENSFDESMWCRHILQTEKQECSKPNSRQPEMLTFIMVATLGFARNISFQANITAILVSQCTCSQDMYIVNYVNYFTVNKGDLTCICCVLRIGISTMNAKVLIIESWLMNQMILLYLIWFWPWNNFLVVIRNNSVTTIDKTRNIGKFEFQMCLFMMSCVDRPTLYHEPSCAAYVYDTIIDDGAIHPAYVWVYE